MKISKIREVNVQGKKCKNYPMQIYSIWCYFCLSHIAQRIKRHAQRPSEIKTLADMMVHLASPNTLSGELGLVRALTVKKMEFLYLPQDLT